MVWGSKGSKGAGRAVPRRRDVTGWEARTGEEPCQLGEPVCWVPPPQDRGGVQRPGRFSVNPGVTRWLGAVVGASPAPPSPHTASGEDRGLMAVVLLVELL